MIFLSSLIIKLSEKILRDGGIGLEKNNWNNFYRCCAYAI